ncbi:MAG: TetR/AcrR family transcriptional regulator, partial [Bacteroidota bacterium]
MAKQGKERIISAAFQLFLKNGYQGVSLKDIIAESQLSKGAIYHHFASKYDIYLAALEEYFFKKLAAVSTEDADFSFAERIKLRYTAMANLCDFVEKMGATGVPYPIRTYFIFQLESERDDAIRKRVFAAVQAYRAEVKAIVQSAMDRGEIPQSLGAETIAIQIIALVEGIAVHH